MDVFVIPVGPDRYELYYEHVADAPVDDGPATKGLVATLQRQFADLLRAAEAHHHRRRESSQAPTSWMGRRQDRLLSWIAERIADQRLLWNLRKEQRVRALYPSDALFEQVLAHVHRALRADFERHRFWLAIDAVGLVLSWPLTVIPGPNVLLFYFLFRVGGHYLSMQGATHGRRQVEWQGQPCDTLVRLRAALDMQEPERHRHVEAVAEALHLSSLPLFFDRVTRTRK
jgi:hypothetical protein